MLLKPLILAALCHGLAPSRAPPAERSRAAPAERAGAPLAERVAAAISRHADHIATCLSASPHALC